MSGRMSLFSFLCAAVFFIAGMVTQIEPFIILAIVFLLIAIAIWGFWIALAVCLTKDGINCAAIFLCLIASIVLYFMNPVTVHIQDISDITLLDGMSKAFIGCVLGTVGSIIILLARKIFGMNISETEEQ